VNSWVKTLVAGLALLAVGLAAGWALQSRRGGASLATSAPSDADTAPSGAGQVVRLVKDPQPVADFSFQELDGREYTLASLRGKVVFVNFWATWCPPCREEIPALVALQEKYKDKIVVVGISEDEIPPSEVRGYAAAQSINYPVAMTTPELRKIFRGVTALPTTFVIDREGRLVQKHVGMLNAAQTELEARVLSGIDTTTTVEHVDDADKVRLRNAAQATEIPGVDLTGLPPARRTAIIKALNSEDCTCGCGLTLAECRINDPSCTVSLPIAQALAKKMAAATDTP
jgi:thiol-disulfide isomerase/thioredoxin